MRKIKRIVIAMLCMAMIVISYNPIASKAATNDMDGMPYWAATLKINLNGGYSVNTKKLPSEKLIEVEQSLEDYKIPLYGKYAARKGYTFAGWYTKASGGKQVKETLKGLGKCFKSGYCKAGTYGTVYAHWNKVQVGTPKINIITNGYGAYRVSISNVKGIKEYKVQYGTKKNFSNAESVFINTNNLYFPISNLKLQKNKTYYVRIKAIKRDSENNRIYSSWSNVITGKIK